MPVPEVSSSRTSSASFLFINFFLIFVKGCLLNSTIDDRSNNLSDNPFVVSSVFIVPTIIKLFPNLISRSEEHTSELQSRGHLVCRLLLEKKKHKDTMY